MEARGAHEVTLTPARTTLVSIAVATLLVALKLGVGIATASIGLISAGVESSGDVVAATLTFFAVRLGGRPADTDHPYGHRRAENLGALGEAAILVLGGVLVSAAAIDHLVSERAAPTVHWYEFAVIAVALLLDLSRTLVSLRAARRFESPAMAANALHFAGDMAGSLAVLIGLIAVRAGLPQGDAVAALIVAVLIFLAAGRLIFENANVLMDRAPFGARESAEKAIAALGPEIELTRLRLRESAGRYFADVVVSVPAGQAVVEAHRSADLVEQAIEATLPGSDVVVHIEPRSRGLELRDRVLAVAMSEPLVKEAHDITIFEQPDGLCVSLHLKFPADIDLRAAHESAERVERAIRARPGVSDVQSHLEPLELPLAAGPPLSGAQEELSDAVTRLVRERTGHAPERVKLLSTSIGRVLFVTLAVDPGASLTAAHTLAGELEELLRERIAGIGDVVVHTDP